MSASPRPDRAAFLSAARRSLEVLTACVVLLLLLAGVAASTGELRGGDSTMTRETLTGPWSVEVLSIGACVGAVISGARHRLTRSLAIWVPAVVTALVADAMWRHATFGLTSVTEGSSAATTVIEWGFAVVLVTAGTTAVGAALGATTRSVFDALQ